MHKTSYSALLLLKDLFTETHMQNPHSCFSYLSTELCKSAVHRDHRSQMFFYVLSALSEFAFQRFVYPCCVWFELCFSSQSLFRVSVKGTCKIVNHSVPIWPNVCGHVPSHTAVQCYLSKYQREA